MRLFRFCADLQDSFVYCFFYLANQGLAVDRRCVPQRFDAAGTLSLFIYDGVLDAELAEQLAAHWAHMGLLNLQ